MSEAKKLCTASDTFYADQFNNPDAAGGYQIMALEMWEQTDKHMDSFVQSVGTAQSLKGVSSVLRSLNPELIICAVEPEESSVLSGGIAGPHKIEGVGAGFIPPMWTPDLADRIFTVTTEDAKDMTRRLAREEALFCGTSSGANVVAAIEMARLLGPGKAVATIACDTGLKYLSTDLYSNA